MQNECGCMLCSYNKTTYCFGLKLFVKASFILYGGEKNKQKKTKQ